MSDVYLAHGENISEYQNQLTYVEGAIGAAIAVGDKVVMLDVFDKPQTCAKVWPRMLTGVVFDALEAGEAGTRPSTEVVQHLLQTANESTWQQAPAVGEGEEFRAESPRGDHLSVLVFDGTIVHGNVMTAV